MKIEKMYSVPQAGKKLGLSARTIERRLRDGLIAAVREPSRGRGKPRIKIPRSALLAYQRSMQAYEAPYVAQAHPNPRRRRVEPLAGVINFV